MQCFYFGCWSANKIGHYMYTAHGGSAYEEGRVLSSVVGGTIDGSASILPGDWVEKFGRWKNRGIEDQGLWRFTTWLMPDRRPLSVLACWDRSADSRGACNSSFFVIGTHDMADAEAEARKSFPMQWARIDAAGSPSTRRRPHEDVLASVGLSPNIAGALTDHALAELAGVIQSLGKGKS